MQSKLPLILSLILYLLILWLRFQQGGWEPKFDLFKDQRQALDQKINQLLPSPQAELLEGILLGENKNLPGSLKLALRDTSTLHIVVASGQNLSLVAGFFLYLTGLIKRKNAVIFGLAASIFYTLLTGLQVPILRAAIMFGLASIAQLLGRERDGFWALLVTVAVMLLINPAWMTSISFQLSVLATFAVIVVAPILINRLNWLPIIGEDLAVSLAAQVMVTPIIAQDFHQFSLVGLFANVLVLWTVSFTMILGTIMIAVSFISLSLAGLISLGVSAFLTYFIYVARFFAGLSWSWIYVKEQVWVVWLGYYLIVAAILVVIARNKVTKQSTNML